MAPFCPNFVYYADPSGGHEVPVAHQWASGKQNEMAGPDPATNSPAGMADISPTKQPVNWLARRR
jgi:hypothetical protein